MSGSYRLASGPVPALVLALAAISAAVLVLHQGRAVDAQERTTLGIDADPTGNSATLLGNRDVCVSVSRGHVFEVDVTVTNVSSLAAWEAYVTYDASVVNIVDRDVQMLLAAPGGNVFDISESVPDNDGRYRVGAANISDPPLGADGSGVLARLTLEAKEPGVANLSVKPIQTTLGSVGATLTRVDAVHIGDTNDDSYFDGATLDARIAVDQPCPGQEEGGPTAAALSGDDGGLAWWIFLAVALGIVVTAGAGGLALIVLRRSGANPTS